MRQIAKLSKVPAHEDFGYKQFLGARVINCAWLASIGIPID